MATVEERTAVDGDKLMRFVFSAVDEIGATLNTALGRVPWIFEAGPCRPVRCLIA